MSKPEYVCVLARFLGAYGVVVYRVKNQHWLRPLAAAIVDFRTVTFSVITCSLLTLL